MLCYCERSKLLPGAHIQQHTVQALDKGQRQVRYLQIQIAIIKPTPQLTKPNIYIGLNAMYLYINHEKRTEGCPILTKVDAFAFLSVPHEHWHLYLLL